MASTLGRDDSLVPGQSIVSPSGQYFLTLQGDGNLALYQQGNTKALWASNTFGKAASKAVVQADGNFVLYDTQGNAVWASNTGGKGQSFLRVQDDGNLVVYLQGNPIWSSRG